MGTLYSTEDVPVAPTVGFMRESVSLHVFMSVLHIFMSVYICTCINIFQKLLQCHFSVHLCWYIESIQCAHSTFLYNVCTRIINFSISSPSLGELQAEGERLH